MADISMRIKHWCPEFDKTATEVIFENQEEPLTSDDLTQLFVQFALACGYAEQSIGESLYGKGSELLNETERRKEENHQALLDEAREEERDE